MKIHPTAIISVKADIGKNVIIGPFCIIHENVKIGEFTEIGSSVEIFPGTSIGKGNIIHKSVVIGGNPQHLTDRSEKSIVRIGNKNVIREFVTIHRGTTEGGGKTIIGDSNYLMVAVHIAHDCRLGNNIIIVNETALSGHTTVQDNASISGLCPIHQFIRIGSYSFIGGGYRVNKDIWPFGLATGEPIGMTGLNIIGLRRAGFKRDVITELKKAYRILFENGDFKFDEKLKEIENNCTPLDEIKLLLEFGRGESKMGLAGRGRRL